MKILSLQQIAGDQEITYKNTLSVVEHNECNIVDNNEGEEHVVVDEILYVEIDILTSAQCLGYR